MDRAVPSLLAVAVVALAGCVGERAAAPPPTAGGAAAVAVAASAPAAAPIGSTAVEPLLTDTVWAAEDTLGGQYRLELYSGGVLYYRTRHGLYRDGHWRYDHGRVLFDLTQRYARLAGGISGWDMAGTGSNRAGMAWSWHARLVIDRNPL